MHHSRIWKWLKLGFFFEMLMFHLLSVPALFFPCLQKWTPLFQPGKKIVKKNAERFRSHLCGSLQASKIHCWKLSHQRVHLLQKLTYFKPSGLSALWCLPVSSGSSSHSKSWWWDFLILWLQKLAQREITFKMLNHQKIKKKITWRTWHRSWWTQWGKEKTKTSSLSIISIKPGSFKD